MYCIKCGVKLADSEKQCPLCATAVFHPHLVQPEGEKAYPKDIQPQQVSPWGGLFIVTLIFLIPLVVTVLCDLRINRAITWSGIVTGSLLVGYVILVLPFWFRKPNPVIFVPCNFLVIGLFLLYMSLYTQGGWFLTFAFPVTGILGLITTTVVTLCRYIRKGRLYIFGGAITVLGCLTPVMEYLLCFTFERLNFYGWSIYPLAVLVLLGLSLILIALCRPLRESLERKFFL